MNEKLVYTTETPEIDPNLCNIQTSLGEVTISLDDLKRIRRALTFTVGEMTGGAEEAILMGINNKLRQLTGERF